MDRKLTAAGKGVSTSFALLVLLALGFLVLLRHAFGAIRVSADAGVH
jgi:hypothetical protein